MQIQRPFGLSDIPEPGNAEDGATGAFAARVRALALEAYDGGHDTAAMVLMRTAELLAALLPSTAASRTGRAVHGDAGEVSPAS